jgi:hypothetical protein
MGYKVRQVDVKHILKQEQRLSYKKIKRMSTNPNSVALKIKRYKCSKILLNFLSASKRIISYDETWLQSMNFQYRGWCLKNHRYTINPGNISKRLTISGAIDNFG